MSSSSSEDGSDDGPSIDEVVPRFGETLKTDWRKYSKAIDDMFGVQEMALELEPCALVERSIQSQVISCVRVDEQQLILNRFAGHKEVAYRFAAKYAHNFTHLLKMLKEPGGGNFRQVDGQTDMLWNLLVLSAPFYRKLIPELLVSHRREMHDLRKMLWVDIQVCSEKRMLRKDWNRQEEVAYTEGEWAIHEDLLRYDPHVVIKQHDLDYLRWRFPQCWMVYDHLQLDKEDERRKVAETDVLRPIAERIAYLVERERGTATGYSSMQQALAEKRTCDLPGCEQLAPVKCGKCKLARYCGPVHQKQDFKSSHRPMCILPTYNDHEDVIYGEGVTPDGSYRPSRPPYFREILNIMERKINHPVVKRAFETFDSAYT